MIAAQLVIIAAIADEARSQRLQRALEGYGFLVRIWLIDPDESMPLPPDVEWTVEASQHILIVFSSKMPFSSVMGATVERVLEAATLYQENPTHVIALLYGSAVDAPISEPDLPLAHDQIIVMSDDIGDALPSLLARLGTTKLNTMKHGQAAALSPMEELCLTLSAPTIDTASGRRHILARAVLSYIPSTLFGTTQMSEPFNFNVPLEAIDANELRWYLEEYYVWPAGLFRERAARVELQLPVWGQALFDAALAAREAQAPFAAWQQAAHTQRCFSVQIATSLTGSVAQNTQTNEAAAELLKLPWELIHDGRHYLFQGQRAVRVIRRLTNNPVEIPTSAHLPIRILLVSPRPDNGQVGYIDHRICALPLVDALEELGNLVELTVLMPPTFQALITALHRAASAGAPFDVVHFDGHGSYDKERGSGILAFEHPNDVTRPSQRAPELIEATQVAAAIRGINTPLMFIGACNSAQADTDPTASVAMQLLEGGVNSVVAMTHAVLVESARRFVRAFYTELTHGARISGGNACWSAGPVHR
jgi:CHAT domain